MKTIIQLVLFFSIALTFLYDFKSKKAKVFLIFLLNMSFVFSTVNIKAFANIKKINSKENYEDVYQNIRISSKLSSNNVPAKKVEYSIQKYGDKNFTILENTYYFKPTITKYVDILNSKTSAKSTYKAITPDVYKATPGFYEINEIYNNGYESIGYLKFEIDKDGNFNYIDGNNFESDNNLSYESGSEIYDFLGNEVASLNQENIFYYEFGTSSNYSMVLYNTASDYNSVLNPPDNYKADISEFEIFYLDEISNEWIKINNPLSENAFFSVELARFGGSSSKYNYHCNLQLSKNTKYKIKEVYIPDGYNKKDENESAIKFGFEFFVNDEFEIENSKMDLETKSFYSRLYNNIFGTLDNEVVFEAIKNELNVKNTMYKFYTLNRKDDNDKKVEEGKNFIDGVTHNIRISSKNESENVEKVEYTLKRFSDINFTNEIDTFDFLPTENTKVNIFYNNHSLKKTWSVSPNVYKASPGFYEIKSKENSLNEVRFEITSEGKFFEIKPYSKTINKITGLGYDLDVENFENEKTYFYDFQTAYNYFQSDMGIELVLKTSSKENYNELFESINPHEKTAVKSNKEIYNYETSFDLKNITLEYVDTQAIGILIALNMMGIYITKKK